MGSYLSFSPFSLFLLYATLLTAVSYLAINYLVYSRRVAQWRKSNIPFLKPSFLIGHKYFLNLTKHSCLVSLDRIYRENKDKDAVGFFLGTLPMVMIRNPAIIKQVFVKNSEKTFQKAFVGSNNDEFSKNMIPLSADKDLWKLNRRAMSSMFNTSRMNGEALVKFRTQIERMWGHAEEVYRKGIHLDVQRMSVISLIDGASNSLFSLDTNSYGKQGELHELFTNSSKPSFMNIVRLYAQMQFPCAHLFDSLRFMGKKQIDSMKNFIRQQIERKSEDQSDFVDFLTKLQNVVRHDKQGSEIDITNQMISFGFAAAFGGVTGTLSIGIELGSLMTMSIHLLSLHPEHQERIRQEVADVMQKHQTSEFTHEVIRDLQFTEQCLLETLRLFPMIPFTTRICSDDVQVPKVDYTFKKGEIVIMNPYSIHRDPKYFKNPGQFDPERFNPENRNTISPESFLAFGTGPRRCPGDKLGLLMVATMIASLLYKFEIKPYSHQRQMAPTDFSPKAFDMSPKEKVLVDVIPREILGQC